MSNLLENELKIINIGIESFNETIRQHKVDSVQLDWSPPAISDNSLTKILNEQATIIDDANKIALDKILKSMPALVALDKAKNVIPGMKKNLVLYFTCRVKDSQVKYISSLSSGP